MLRSQIHVDLPSEETERKRSLVEVLRSSIGYTPDLRTGREELSIGCLDVVRAIMACFYRSSIHNAIGLRVDEEQVFLDTLGIDNDAEKLLEAVERYGKTNPSFGALQLTAEHRHEGLHVVITVQVASSVALGDREMQITLSARPEALQHVERESAEDYANRLIEFAHSDKLEQSILSLEKLTSRVAQQFQTQMGIRAVVQGAVEAMLVRPQRESVERFTELDFATVGAPRYQPLVRQAHPDNYHQHFADPLYEFQNFILIAEVISHHVWAIAQLVLLEREGTLWGTGDELDTCDPSRWIDMPTLLYCDDGSLLLTES